MHLPNLNALLRRTAIVAAVSLAAAGVAAPTAAARPGGIIHTGANGVTALGSWQVRTHPSYGAAIRAMGSPNAVHRQSSSTCLDAWSGLGLRILFTTFGGGSGCQAAFAQRGTISGPAGRRWQTARGLRVGDSLGKLKRLYPRAINGPGGWAIISSLHSVVAEGSRLDIVKAQIKHNRVFAFSLWFGGAGD